MICETLCRVDFDLRDIAHGCLPLLLICLLASEFVDKEMLKDR